ncbi:MAG: zinc metallopeptidase, partial [Oscillospiraceae bacterium]
IKVRAAIIPITQLGSNLSMPLVLVGFFMGAQPLVNFGILLFATMTVFQLVTLPVEFNASSRAVMALEMGGSIAPDEIYGVKKVLGAAALTYVAALAVSLANLLRLVMLFGRRDD